MLSSQLVSVHPYSISYDTPKVGQTFRTASSFGATSTGPSTLFRGGMKLLYSDDTQMVVKHELYVYHQLATVDVVLYSYFTTAPPSLKCGVDAANDTGEARLWPVRIPCPSQGLLPLNRQLK